MLLPPLVKLILLSDMDWWKVGLSLNSTAAFWSLLRGRHSTSKGFCKLPAMAVLASSVNFGTTIWRHFRGNSLTHLSSSLASASIFSLSSLSCVSFPSLNDLERFREEVEPFLLFTFPKDKLVKLPVLRIGCCGNSGEMYTLSLLLP